MMMDEKILYEILTIFKIWDYIYNIKNFNDMIYILKNSRKFRSNNI